MRDFVPRTYFEVFGDFDVIAGRRHACSPGGEKLSGALVRRELQEEFDREDSRPGEDLGAAARGDDCLQVCAVSRQHRRGKETDNSGRAAPLRSHHLQREANTRFSLSARRTLQIVQTLYERHKVLTLPPHRFTISA